jgi:hypothetical protein
LSRWATAWAVMRTDAVAAEDGFGDHGAGDELAEDEAR